MANCLIAYPNRADECTLSGGAWSSALPLGNLQTRFIGQVARSTNTALTSTQFTATMIKQRAVRIVALVGHTLSNVAQYRLRLYSDAGVTTVFDSGWKDVWPAIYPPSALEWEIDAFWDGTIQDDERAGMTVTLPIVLPTPILATALTLELSDATNSAGYVDLGRLFIAGEWQPVWNMAYGASLAYETDTAVAKSLGGVEHFDERKAVRVARFQLDTMSIDEAMGRAFDMQRTVGVSREVFYMYDPEDTTHLLRRAFLGRLRTLSPIEHLHYDHAKTAFEVQEII